MKKKFIYIFVALFVFLSSTVNVYAENECKIFPDGLASGELIYVPSSFVYECTYTFDSKASTYSNKAGSFEFNKIIIDYSGIDGYFSLYGLTSNNKHYLLDFTVDGQIGENFMENDLYNQNDGTYYFNKSKFGKNVSIEYVSVYGCPPTFTMDSQPNEKTIFTFDDNTNPTKGSSSSAFLVFKLDNTTGGVLSDGNYKFSATLDFDTLYDINESYSKKIVNYIQNTYGKDKYIKDYKEYSNYISVACDDNISPYNPHSTPLTPEEKEGIEKCENLLTKDTIDFIKMIFTWIQIAAPILVIVLGGVDFAGALLKDDADALKKAIGTFTKRLIIAVILFFVPIIIKFVLDNLNEITGHNSTTCGIK